MELSKYFNNWNGNTKVHSFEMQQHLQIQEGTLWDFKSPHTHFQPTFLSVWMSCWTHISVPLSFGPSVPLFVTKYLCIETVHIENRATSHTLLFQGFCSLFPRAIGLPGSEQAQLGAVLREQGPALQSTLFGSIICSVVYSSSLSSDRQQLCRFCWLWLQGKKSQTVMVLAAVILEGAQLFLFSPLLRLAMCTLGRYCPYKWTRTQ